MRAGRPQLVVPFSHDHFDNAMRVQRQGLGWSLSRNVSAAKLSRNLGRLLADRRIRDWATVIAEQVRTEDGTQSACTAVEDLLVS